MINKTSKKNIVCLMKVIAVEKNKAKRVTKDCLMGVGSQDGRKHVRCRPGQKLRSKGRGK